MKTVSLINHIITLLFAACYFYQFLYIFVPFVKKTGRLKPGNFTDMLFSLPPGMRRQL